MEEDNDKTIAVRKLAEAIASNIQTEYQDNEERLFRRDILEIEKNFIEIVKPIEIGFQPYGLCSIPEKQPEEEVVYLPDDLSFVYGTPEMRTYEEARRDLIFNIRKYIHKQIQKYGPSKLYWRSMPTISEAKDFDRNEPIFVGRARGTIIPNKVVGKTFKEHEASMREAYKEILEA